MLSSAQKKAIKKIGFDRTISWYDIHPATRKILFRMGLVRRLCMTTSADRLELTGAGRAALEAEGGK